MRSILLCMVFTTTSLVVYAQTDPVSIHTTGILDINYTEYDSVTTYSDTAVGAIPESAGKYIIQNKTRVVEGFVDFQLVSNNYISEQTPQAYIVYEITSFATNDTAGAYFFYADQNGRDTAIVQSSYFGGTFTPTFKNRYYYSSQGLLDSISSYFYQSPSMPIKQLTQVYYRSNRLDSAYYYTFSAIPTQQPVKYYYTYGVNGRLLLMEGYRDQGSGYEVFTRSVMHHNAFDEIVRIDSYVKFPGSPVFDVTQVVEFHKSHTFDIPENQLRQLSIDPNPAKDIIHIEGHHATQKLDYEVYGLSGKLIKEGCLEQQSLDISILKRGIYILKISGDGLEPQSFRLLKD